MGIDLPHHTQVLQPITCWSVKQPSGVIVLIIQAGKRGSLAIRWIDVCLGLRGVGAIVITVVARLMTLVFVERHLCVCFSLVRHGTRGILGKSSIARDP